jgi:hypothetical protein
MRASFEPQADNENEGDAMPNGGNDWMNLAGP